MQNNNLADIDFSNVACFNCKTKAIKNEVLTKINSLARNGYIFNKQTIKEDLKYFLCSDCQRFKCDHHAYINSFEVEA